MGIQDLDLGSVSPSGSKIGENRPISFRFHVCWIIIAYGIGFALLVFTMFVIILGRYDYNQQVEMEQKMK